MVSVASFVPQHSEGGATTRDDHGNNANLPMARSPCHTGDALGFSVPKVCRAQRLAIFTFTRQSGAQSEVGGQTHC